MTDPAKLLPSNSTAAERAIVSAAVEPVPVPITDLWNPDRCPAYMLPWLAWALSVDAWKDYWPENIKRARIRTAIEVQRRKGTSKSVRDVVAAFGGQVVLREWWENDPPTVPHTFDMTITLSGDGGVLASAEFADDVIGEVMRTKPVRSHFTFTQGIKATAGIGVVAAGKVAIYRRLNFIADNT